MRKTLAWLLPLAAVPVIALLAFGLTRDPSVLPSTLIGKPAPEFRLETLYEPADSLALDDFRGRVVVLNYWASWCGPCVAEHPVLVRLNESYDPEDVQLLGVLFQDEPANGRAFLDRLGGGWPVVVDRGSRISIQYGVYGVPETFFITPDGIIAHKEVGPVSWSLVQAKVDSLLAERGPRSPDAKIGPLETAPDGR